MSSSLMARSANLRCDVLANTAWTPELAMTSVTSNVGFWFLAVSTGATAVHASRTEIAGSSTRPLAHAPAAPDAPAAASAAAAFSPIGPDLEPERSAGASTAVPLTTLVALVLLWFGISLPLVLVGAYFGFTKPAIEVPVRVNQIARHVPEQMWYTHPLFAIALGGILPFGAVCIELFFIMSAMWLHQVRRLPRPRILRI